MKVKCTNCSKEFNQKPSLASGNNFCSRDCYYKFNKNRKRNLKSLVGQRFGMLEVLKEGSGKTYPRNKKVRTWIVKCDCGKEKEIATQHLKSTKSCGCLKLKPETNWLFQKDRVNAVVKELFRSYRKGAVRRNLEFKLSFEYFKKLVTSNCYYCNEGQGNKTKHDYDSHVQVIGVDRKNNEDGYIEENSVPCCGTCNYMKRKFSVEQFINQAIKISKNHDNKK